MKKQIARILILALIGMSTILGPLPSFAGSGFMGPVILNMVEHGVDNVITFHVSFENDIVGELLYAITPIAEPRLTDMNFYTAPIQGNVLMNSAGFHEDVTFSVSGLDPATEYKLEMALWDAEEVYYFPSETVPFVTASLIDVGEDAQHPDGYEVFAESNAEGTLIGLVYPPGAVSTVAGFSNPPLAIAEADVSGDTGQLLILRNNALQSKMPYDVHFLLVDKFGVPHWDRVTVLNNPVVTGGNRLLAVSYDNGDNNNTTDDRILLNFQYPVMNAGDPDDYTLSLADEFPHSVVLEPSDYMPPIIVDTTIVAICINSTGLAKFDEHTEFDFGTLTVTVSDFDALVPKVTDIIGQRQASVPLEQAIIHMPNLPRMIEVTHSDNGTPIKQDDDALNVVYDQTLDWAGHTNETYSVAYMLPQVDPEQFITLNPNSDYNMESTPSPSNTLKLNLSPALINSLMSNSLVVFRVSLHPDHIPLNGQSLPTIDGSSPVAVVTWMPNGSPPYNEESQPPNVILPNEPPPYFDPTEPYAPPPDITPEQIEQITATLSLFDNPNTDLPPDMAVNQLEMLNKILGGADTYTDTQLFRTLIKLDDTLNVLDTFMEDPNKNTDEVLDEIETMTQNVESKISQLENPVDALTVADQYITSLTKIKSDTEIPMTSINESIEGMLNDISMRLGTVAIESPTIPSEPVAIGMAVLQRAIDRQDQYAEQLQALSDKFFGEDSTRTVVTSVVLAFEQPKTADPIQTSFDPEVVQQLKEGPVDQLAMSVGGSRLTLPTSEVKSDSSLILQISFKPVTPPAAPVSPPGTDGTKSGSETPVPTQIVDFKVLENGQVKENFQQPLELRFELKDFGVAITDLEFASIYKLNEETGAWTAVGGCFECQLGVIFVKRRSLSQYTVMKSKKSFSDSDTSWAKSEINALLNKGIVEETTSFQPKALLTRAEFASWIAKAYGLTAANSKPVPFNDIKPNDANYDAVAAVYQMGIIAGKSAKTFDPNGNITADEMAVIIGKTLIMFDNKKASEKVKSKHLASLKEKKTASWAEEDQALLMELGIASGEAFAKGDGFVTKETAAATFSKFYNS